MFLICWLLYMNDNVLLMLINLHQFDFCLSLALKVSSWDGSNTHSTCTWCGQVCNMTKVVCDVFYSTINPTFVEETAIICYIINCSIQGLFLSAMVILTCVCVCACVCVCRHICDLANVSEKSILFTCGNLENVITALG